MFRGRSGEEVTDAGNKREEGERHWLHWPRHLLHISCAQILCGRVEVEAGQLLAVVVGKEGASW